MLEDIGNNIGKYRLIELLGQGGFAVVYRAEYLPTRTQVALKMLHVDMSGDAPGKFLSEAQTISSLDHPNIVKMLEFGIKENTPYFAMTFAPHGTLRQLHPMGRILPLPTVLTYVKQVAAALQYAHDHKVIHCDVKPENMLLGPSKNILLSDFGIATKTHSMQSAAPSAQEQLPAGGVLGTTTYMAPEQFVGKTCRASDQYALATVVYEWLCGTAPFVGAALEVGIRHLRTPPAPMSTHVPTINPAIEAVVMRALAKNPDERFASVQDFANALRSAYMPILLRQASCDRPPSAAEGRKRTWGTTPDPSQGAVPLASPSSPQATVPPIEPSTSVQWQRPLSQSAAFSVRSAMDSKRGYKHPLVWLAALAVACIFGLMAMVLLPALPGSQQILSKHTNISSRLLPVVHPTTTVTHASSASTQATPTPSPTPIATAAPTLPPVAVASSSFAGPMKISPTQLSPQNCPQDNNGYMCTVTLSITATAVPVRWYINGINGVAAKPTPATGSLSSNQSQDVTIHVLQCTPGTLQFGEVQASSSGVSMANIAVSWQC